jgi:hypothetical protein
MFYNKINPKKEKRIKSFGRFKYMSYKKPPDEGILWERK